MAETLEITSSGSGIPLVFIHGWGFNSGIWQPLVEQFTDLFTVITIDLPGFGKNAGKAPADYSLEAIAAQVQTAVGRPAIYAGWSLGGLVATEIALNEPQQVLGLVTIASSPCFIEKADWPGIKGKLLSGFHLQLADNIENTIENFLKIQAMGSPHLRQDLKEIHRLLMTYPLPERKTLDDSLSLLETCDRRERLADIGCPFLRLYGRNDVLVPKSIYPMMEPLAPQSEVLVFEGASHAPFISHQQEFCRQLKNWLVKHYR